MEILEWSWYYHHPPSFFQWPKYTGIDQSVRRGFKNRYPVAILEAHRLSAFDVLQCIEERQNFISCLLQLINLKFILDHST